MSGPADRVLELIYVWIKEAKKCSSHLHDLAEEMETLRRDCNIAQTVGSTTAVAGTVVAIAAAPFTGGASLAAAGALAAGVGAGVSLGTNLTEWFLSSSKLEQAKETDRRCNKIAAEIQQLFQRLREMCPSKNKDERDKHVVKEFLKAICRQSGLSARTDINAKVNSIVMSNALVQAQAVPNSLRMLIVNEVLMVLSLFSLKLEGPLLTALSAGKALGMGEVVAFGSVSARVLGGVVGLAFSLPEAIQNWQEAIQNNHETEASRSLRELVQKIVRAVKRLKDMIEKIKEWLETECEDSDSGDEEELKMALVNTRSANKFIKPRDRALIDLIMKNNVEVLLITETWFLVDSVHNIRTILPPNYNLIHNPRFFGRGGGVAIVYKNTLAAVQLPFDFTSTFEFVAATITPPASAETLLVLSVYRPPGGSAAEINDFLTELRMFLIDVNATNIKNIIIGGDFNIWVDQPNMPATQGFLGILRESGFVENVTQPTHRAGHILDLVLSKPSVRITDVSVRANAFSDHHTVFFSAWFKDTIRGMSNLSVSKKCTKKKHR